MKPNLHPPSASDALPVAELSARLCPERPEDPPAWQRAATGTAEHPYWVASDPEQGRVVGYACARPEPGRASGIWRIHIGVEPDWRRQGIGSLLFDRLMAELLERQATEVRIRVPDPRPEAAPPPIRSAEARGVSCPAAEEAPVRETLAFLERRGFTPYDRMLFLEQDLTGLPELPDEPLHRAKAAGVTFTTLREELERPPEALRAVYTLYTATTADIPTAEGVSAPTYEAYVRSLQDPLLLPDCFFIARIGEAYIGMSYAAKSHAAPYRLGQRYTGVLREFRGRSIALALKCLVTRYASHHGYRRVTTATLEANRPMRAVNEALGFTVRYVEVRMGRLLRP